MRLRLDGHRLTADEILALLDQTGFREMSERHIANGYRLNPVRAPRRMQNGSVGLQFSWSRREGDFRSTLRLRIMMAASPV